MTLPIVSVGEAWSQPADQEFTGLFTLQNISGFDVQAIATADATPPDAGAVGLLLKPGATFAGYTLAELFPHVAGATRIWFSSEMICKVYFSHA
ncbi:MAG: hypothetical protein VX228_06400 [Pseudomonadota bacterium]|nr:hypothetical protein [Pseudomonadota bacterium]